MRSVKQSLAAHQLPVANASFPRFEFRPLVPKSRFTVCHIVARSNPAVRTRAVVTHVIRVCYFVDAVCVFVLRRSLRTRNSVFFRPPVVTGQYLHPPSSPARLSTHFGHALSRLDHLHPTVAHQPRVRSVVDLFDESTSVARQVNARNRYRRRTGSTYSSIVVAVSIRVIISGRTHVIYCQCCFDLYLLLIRRSACDRAHLLFTCTNTSIRFVYCRTYQ